MRFDNLARLPSTGSHRERRADADLSQFAARALLHVVEKTYDDELTQLEAKKWIPTGTNGIHATAMAWMFRGWSKRGSAKLIGHNVNDLPRVGQDVHEKALPIKELGNMYGYSLFEFEAAQFTGQNLDTQRAAMCRQYCEELQDDILWTGNVQANLPGFLTNVSIPRVIVPTGGWLNGTLTAAQAIADITALVDSIQFSTNQIRKADTLLLPWTHYRLLENLLIPNTTVSALEQFKKNNGNITAIEPVLRLATAGPGGTPTMIAYNRSPNYVQGIEVAPFRQLDPQVHGLETTVICFLRTGGTAVFFPETAAFGDGI